MFSPVQSFPRETRGRRFVVGDIHGCFTRLKAALKLLNFDTSVDTLYCCGDLVDRGPESGQVDEWFVPWLRSVRGNHCHNAIAALRGKYDITAYTENPKEREKYRDNHIRNGGYWALQMREYDRERGLRIADHLEKLPFLIEVETAAGLMGIVHAEPPMSWPATKHCLLHPEILDERSHRHFFSSLLYARSRYKRLDTERVEGVDRVFVGHTVVKHSTHLGKVVYTDTGLVFNYGLTFYNLDSPWMPITFPAWLLDRS